MELKTDRKKARIPPSSSSRGAESSCGFRSLIERTLTPTVELRAMDARTTKTLNCVLPKKWKYCGKLR